MYHRSRTVRSVFELRWYDIKPDCVGAYAKLTGEHFGLRTRHSKLLGFWSMEIGGPINQFFHVWQYDDLAHRKRVRDALAVDAAWQQDYVAKVVPLFNRQSNALALSGLAHPPVVPAFPFYALLRVPATTGATHSGLPSGTTVVHDFRTVLSLGTEGGTAPADHVVVGAADINAFLTSMRPQFGATLMYPAPFCQKYVTTQ